MIEYGFTITDKGQALLTKLLAGEQLTLTRVMVGDGRLSGQDPKTLTDLVLSRHQATTTIPKVQDGAVVFTIQYQNEEETVFPLNEYGVFATDPDEGEILLYYATLGDCPQYVMPGGADIRRFPVSIALSANDVNVVLAFDASAFVSSEFVEEYLSGIVLPAFEKQIQETVTTHNEDTEAHAILQNKMEELESRIIRVEDGLFSNITGNPFLVSFNSMTGIMLVKGVWNEERQRIEC